jgi:hypothetical protein
VPGNNSPFRDIQHAVAEGPALVGSPEQVIDKILSYHSLYNHDLQSISLPTTLPFEQQLQILERFALEVIPAVRASAPSTLWEARRPVRRQPGVRRGHRTDAAAAVTADHAFNRTDNAQCLRTLKAATHTETALEAFDAEWQDWHDGTRAPPCPLPRLPRCDPPALAHRNEATRLEGAPGTWSAETTSCVLSWNRARACRRWRGTQLRRAVELGPIEERGGINLVSGDTVIEVAKRGGEYIVRPRNPSNALLQEYQGTPAYTPNAAYAVAGTFVPFEAPRPTTVGAAVEGIQHVYEAPGEIRFKIAGRGAWR